MDQNFKESATVEISMRHPGEQEAFTYFRYKLSRPVICTINFRDSLTQKVPSARVAPIKIGEGNKFTQEGVMKVPRGFNPFITSRFRQALIEYSQSTQRSFKEVTQLARIKVFFKGFPFGTSVEAIKQYFSTFGKIEYLYIMTPSKTRGRSPVMQGYFIFGSNDETIHFLENKPSLYFGWSFIQVEIYQGAKKKRNLSGRRHTYYGFAAESAFLEGKALISLRDQDRSIPNNFYLKKTSGQTSLDYGESQAVEVLSPSVAFDQVKQARPYMVNVGLVKLNTTKQANLRFNLRLMHQLVRDSNWNAQDL